jgi:hypothetical protein
MDNEGDSRMMVNCELGKVYVTYFDNVIIIFYSSYEFMIFNFYFIN